ncbi:NAD(P)-dependent oxidoreductase [Streptomyces sp. NPDC005892]|uniref:NAD(P)-dependent oxidoreductase n=1 Tax=Streptomyces sp. NPDC005892 TaxID=3155593 RepID=UPI0033DBD59B
MPGPGLLARARLLTAPGLGPEVRRGLAEVTGRDWAAYPDDGAPEATRTPDDGTPGGGGPVVYVGASRPAGLPVGDLVWFHSVNAGTDGLLAPGPWPAGALLTRTVGRMGERIAQYVLAWVLAECQSVPEFAARHARGEWRREPSELAAGQTALVHGTGRIGSAVAGLLRACGLRTVGVARTAPGVPPPGFDRVVVAGGPAERDALGEARWVVAALPLTAATENYFGSERFGCVRGASFVNVGRGATVDLAALEHALRAGSVRRAVLDVLPSEPAVPGDPCWRLPRTVVTSHSAGITADEDIVTDFAACWAELHAGRWPELTVDPGRGY